MATVHLALGSNIGNRQGFLDVAIKGLKSGGLTVRKISRVIETNPWGGPKQGKYLNAVLKADTELSPEDLHLLTRSIEYKLGRIRTVVNGPRVIDIDILLYDDIKLVSKNLIIPHPRMLERPFVMDPLKEIDPRVCALLKI